MIHTPEFSHLYIKNSNEDQLYGYEFKLIYKMTFWVPLLLDSMPIINLLPLF